MVKHVRCLLLDKDACLLEHDKYLTALSTAIVTLIVGTKKVVIDDKEPVADLLPDDDE